MSDGFERRALLLQVGEAFKIVGGKSGKGAGPLVARAALEGRSAADAALTLTRAFASWPTLLLAEKLDRKALAKLVSAVFAGNPVGWKAYLKAVQKDVPGFGEGVAVEAPGGEHQSTKVNRPEPEKKAASMSSEAATAQTSRAEKDEVASNVAPVQKPTTEEESVSTADSQAEAAEDANPAAEAIAPSRLRKPADTGTSGSSATA